MMTVSDVLLTIYGSILNGATYRLVPITMVRSALYTSPKTLKNDEGKLSPKNTTVGLITPSQLEISHLSISPDLTAS